MSVSNFLRGFVDCLSGKSEAERAYAEQLRRRARLSDDEFYEKFYSATGIPKDIPARLRKLYQTIMGYDFSALRPEDNFALIYDWLDFADVLYRVEKEFKVTIPPTTWKSEPRENGEINGTFDSVVRYLDKTGCGKQSY